MKFPLDRIRTVVTLYDRLADDPQAQETLLGPLDGVDHGAVASSGTSSSTPTP